MVLLKNESSLDLLKAFWRNGITDTGSQISVFLIPDTAVQVSERSCWKRF